MATVWIPGLMRDLTGGRQTVEVPGATVREIILALDAAFPGCAGRLLDRDGTLQPHVAVAVDGEQAESLRDPVGSESEVHFLPAISGG